MNNDPPIVSKMDALINQPSLNSDNHPNECDQTVRPILTENSPMDITEYNASIELSTLVTASPPLSFPVVDHIPTNISEEGAGAVHPSSLTSNIGIISSFSPQIKLTLDSSPVFMECIVPFLDLRGVQNLCCTTSLIRETILYSAGPKTIIINRPTTPLDSSSRSPSFKVFQQFGSQLHYLTVSIIV